MVATVQPTVQPVSMQGIAIPAAIVDGREFMRRTRRHIQQEKTLNVTIQPAASGPSNTTDVIELRKADILSEITVRITGNLVVNPGTGSAASTAAWPYGLVKSAVFTANGASNLQNAGGWTYRAREFAKDEGLTDRGVTQTIGGVSRNQGTLALASEAWGVGSNTTGLTNATTPVDVLVTIPVAEDPFDLTGAIFLQTSTADLTLTINWAQIAELFTLAGNATASFTGSVQVYTTKFSIPTVNGAIIVPDLSQFHSLIESSYTALQTGIDNEVRVTGQGAGKTLLRAIYRVLNGATPVPLPMTDANFGLQAWRFATNETPDQFPNGSAMRYWLERQYSVDLGGLAGFGVIELAKAGFRDTLDMGTAAELRIVSNILNSVTLTSPKLTYALETLFASGQAA
jgi:hypothetical protein